MTSSTNFTLSKLKSCDKSRDGFKNDISVDTCNSTKYNVFLKNVFELNHYCIKKRLKGWNGIELVMAELEAA